MCCSALRAGLLDCSVLLSGYGAAGTVGPSGGRGCCCIAVRLDCCPAMLLSAPSGRTEGLFTAIAAGRCVLCADRNAAPSGRLCCRLQGLPTGRYYLWPLVMRQGPLAPAMARRDCLAATRKAFVHCVRCR